GTIVPQRIWEPLQRGDRSRRVVQGVAFQLPIFFRQRGVVGIPLRTAAGGYTDSIEDGNYHAPVGDRTTTHLTLSWPGYDSFRQEVEFQDSSRRPITIAKLAERTGRFVQRFIEASQRCLQLLVRWTVGVPDDRAPPILREEIIIVGVVHV
ncbi:hypothetical protein K488DRAFT_28013, partial [Vararia minispora EC-137]